MSPAVYAEYRRIFRSLKPGLRTALEVGALSGPAGLLTCDDLQHIAVKIGINLRECGSHRGVPVMLNDARHIAFADDSFDLVLCSSTLEHVPDFWRVCHEMKRVLAPAGLLVVNVPGFTDTPLGNRMRYIATRLRLPDALKRATTTFRVHEAPNDYYRFSAYCMREVVLADLVDVKVWTRMTPPRMFGLGMKPRYPRNSHSRPTARGSEERPGTTT